MSGANSASATHTYVNCDSSYLYVKLKDMIPTVYGTEVTEFQIAGARKGYPTETARSANNYFPRTFTSSLCHPFCARLNKRHTCESRPI